MCRLSVSFVTHQEFEILKNVFYYSIRVTNVENTNCVYFTTDREYIYCPIAEEKGPYSLSQIYKYCNLLHSKIEGASSRQQKIVHYSNSSSECACEFQDYRVVNAILLVACFSVLCLNKTAADAISPFQHLLPSLPLYPDLIQETTYELNLLNCVKGLEKAVRLRYIRYNSFNCPEYEYYKQLKNGDMNWIIPGKILAMRGPRDKRKLGLYTQHPALYARILKRFGVTAVVRLNKNHYDKSIFTVNGINHYDLPFSDCTTPSLPLVRQFLAILRREAVVAVHCRAGLGRTGTMIGCALIMNQKFTAAEAIAWMRMCRPGSVMGIQQFFLEDMEPNYRRKLRENVLIGVRKHLEEMELLHQ